MEFAQWVASIHKKRCHVVYTDYRPVPLQHFIMPCDSDRAPLFCVVRPHERWYVWLEQPLLHEFAPLSSVNIYFEIIISACGGLMTNEYHQILMHGSCMLTLSALSDPHVTSSYTVTCLTLTHLG